MAALSRPARAGALVAVAVAAALAPGLILGAAPARAAAASAGIAVPSQCIGRSGAASQTAGWPQQLLEPSRLWDMTTGAGQIVAVLDSGVSAAAPALAGAVLPGLNVPNGHPADSDCLGHGTFAAGIIAGRPVRGTAFTGMAPGARILPVDVVGSSSTTSAGTVTAAALAAGIRYAVSAGATIIDVSAATTPGPSASLQAAVRFAAASNVVVIAPASGTPDNGSLTGQTGYPAAYPGVLAVSAVSSGAAPAPSSGSQAQPDLAAPGVDVPGIGPHGLGQLDGTGDGIATAFVAGTAALVRSYYPQLSAAQVVQRLEVTADPPGTAVPSPQVGYGVVDPYSAVTMILPQESGGQAPPLRQAGRVRLPALVPPDPWPLAAALIIGAAVLTGITLAFAAAHIVPQGRKRDWRPAPGWGRRTPP